ncbi:MAG: mycofactocin precursor MftA [Acidimicrobiales bacterium]
MDAKRAQGAGSVGVATDESATAEDRSGGFEIFEISIDGMCGVY